MVVVEGKFSVQLKPKLNNTCEPKVGTSTEGAPTLKVGGYQTVASAK